MAKFEKLKFPSYGTMPGVAFHASDLQLSANGPRVLLFGGQRQGISGAMWSLEQSTGEGFVQLPDAPEEGGGPPPPPRTQTTLTSIGAEPQEVLILIAGFALNIGCMNDVWRCTISLDAASMPVPTWEELSPAGTAPEPRYGHSASSQRSLGGRCPWGDFGRTRSRTWVARDDLPLPTAPTSAFARRVCTCGAFGSCLFGGVRKDSWRT